MSKRLFKGISIGMGILLTGVLMGSFALGAKEELTPSQWLGLAPKDRVKYKTIEVVTFHDHFATWLCEDKLDITPFEKFSDYALSVDPGTPYEWYIRQLFSLSHPKVKVIYKEVPLYNPEALQVMMADLAAGTALSVYPTIWGTSPSLMIEKGLARDITDYVNKWDQTPYLMEHFPKLWGPCWKDGRCYGIPHNGPGVGGIQFRKDWFRKAGIFNEKGEPRPSDDWTWSDLREIAKKLTDPKAKKWGFGYRQVDPGGAISAAAFAFGVPLNRGAAGTGYPWVIPDKTGKYTWQLTNQPQLKKALKFFQEMRWKDNSLFVGPPSKAGIGGDFAAGRLGMLYGSHLEGAWFFDPVFHPYKYDPKIRSEEIVGFALEPTGPYGIRNKMMYDGHYFFNPTLSKEEMDATWDWVMFACRYNKDLEFLCRYLIDTKGIGQWHNGLYWVANHLTKFTPPPEVQKMINDLIPQEEYATYKKVKALPEEPIPWTYGLEIKPGAAEYIHGMIQEILGSADADVDALLAKTAKDLQSKVLNYKIKDDKKKFKAYYTALDEWYKKYYPKWYKSQEYKETFEKYYKVW